MTAKTAKPGPIYIGIGGWTFAPWRGLFYPPGLPHSKELSFAAARLTSIRFVIPVARRPVPSHNRKPKSKID